MEDIFCSPVDTFRQSAVLLFARPGWKCDNNDNDNKQISKKKRKRTIVPIIIMIMINKQKGDKNSTQWGFEPM